ncbi:MAG: HEAT repeat domain-containing protein [Planctomycetota bacterium]
MKRRCTIYGYAALLLVAAAGCRTAYVPPDSEDLIARLHGSTDDDERAEAISGLAKLSVMGRYRLDGDEALGLTRDASPVVRARALALYLEDWDLPAELAHTLGDDDPRVRAAAVNLMSRRRLVGGTDALAGFLARRAEGEGARCLAADALAATGDVGAWGPLTKALGDESAEVRERAARALGTLWARRTRVGGPDSDTQADAVEALTGLLGDPSLDARVQAVRVLAAMGKSESIPQMAEAIRDARGWRRLAMLRRFAAEARAPSYSFLDSIYGSENESAVARYEAGKGLHLLGTISKGDVDDMGDRAMREAFEREGEFADGDLFALGWRPAWVDSSHFAGTLAPDGPHQYQLLWRMDREKADLIFAGSYSTLEENRTGRSAELVLVDLGRAREKPFTTDPLRQKRRLRTAFFHGPSVGRFDFASGLDEYAFGWSWRAGLNFPVRGRVGIDIHIDAHAWLEGRNRDWHFAGSGAMGVNLIVCH